VGAAERRRTVRDWAVGIAAVVVGLVRAARSDA
jgi:hypothetical protein